MDDLTAAMAALQARIGALEDRQAVADLVDTYARGVQRREPELTIGCFTSDAILDFGFVRLEGIDAIRAFFTGSNPETRRTIPTNLEVVSAAMPLMPNVHVELDGDRARIETTGLTIHSGERGGLRLTIVRGVRYDDEAVRTPEGWKLQVRIHESKWSIEAPQELGSIIDGSTR
jgi:hypothetical protein